MTKTRIDELINALRELHDFAEPSPHYRYAHRSREAFKLAAELLKTTMAEKTNPTTVDPIENLRKVQTHFLQYDKDLPLPISAFQTLANAILKLADELSEASEDQIPGDTQSPPG